MCHHFFLCKKEIIFAHLMPILVQKIVDRLRADLDAEGSDRYLFDQDFKPAINKAQEWLVSAFNIIFGDKKMSEENLRELTFVRIWVASTFSRIGFNPDDVGHDLWTIFAVYPKPIVYPSGNPPIQPGPAISSFIPSVAFIESERSAKRLTLEQWNENKTNPFMAGNTTVSESLKEYAYLGQVDYSGGNNPNYTPNDPKEIQIRPSVAGEFVAIAYLKRPTEVIAITDSLEFPESLMLLIGEKALNFMAYKQGDNTSAYLVTERDISRILNMMS